MLESAVLSTIHVDDVHTAENLAAELMSITDKWEIIEKAACVIIDNANNTVSAVRQNGWKHSPHSSPRHSSYTLVVTSIYSTPLVCGAVGLLFPK